VPEGIFYNHGNGWSEKGTQDDFKVHECMVIPNDVASICPDSGEVMAERG